MSLRRVPKIPSEEHVARSKNENHAKQIWYSFRTYGKCLDTPLTPLLRLFRPKQLKKRCSYTPLTTITCIGRACAQRHYLQLSTPPVAYSLVRLLLCVFWSHSSVLSAACSRSRRRIRPCFRTLVTLRTDDLYDLCDLFPLKDLDLSRHIYSRSCIM